MEDVLDVYELPYNPQRPVVCMDEKPYQLLGEARSPLPMRPGNDQKVDSEYVRNGTCSIFAFVEPLGGAHHVSVREHRTAIDWAEEIKYLADVMYPDVENIILVMDNLNTHKPASLFKRYPADEARRIMKRLEIHYTPKHGSWLDIADQRTIQSSLQYVRYAEKKTKQKTISSIGAQSQREFGRG